MTQTKASEEATSGVLTGTESTFESLDALLASIDIGSSGFSEAMKRSALDAGGYSSPDAMKRSALVAGVEIVVHYGPSWMVRDLPGYRPSSEILRDISITGMKRTAAEGGTTMAAGYGAPGKVRCTYEGGIMGMKRSALDMERVAALDDGTTMTGNGVFTPEPKPAVVNYRHSSKVA